MRDSTKPSSKNAGKKPKVLAVIPARSGSRGVQNKNIRELAGRPLISYMIESALKAKNVDRVIVSTNDEGIAKIARDCGAEVPFIRPEELAADDVCIIPVIVHAMHQMDGLGWKADIVLSLQPTAPLTSPEDIDKVVDKLLNTDCDSAVSVFKIIVGNPIRAYKIEGDMLLPFSDLTVCKAFQRQDLPPAVAFNSAIFARRRELLDSWDGTDIALGNDTRAVLMGSESSVDINEELDFIVAEALLRRRYQNENHIS